MNMKGKPFFPVSHSAGAYYRPQEWTNQKSWSLMKKVLGNQASVTTKKHTGSFEMINDILYLHCGSDHITFVTTCQTVQWKGGILLYISYKVGNDI